LHRRVSHFDEFAEGEVMLERLTVSGPRMSRRTFNALLLSVGAPPLAPAALHAQAPPSAPRPFRVEIPQAKIDRILSQVRDAEWPDRLDAPDLRYGVSWDYMRELADYWTTKFDWGKAEANLNRYPQFLTRVGDYDIPHTWMAWFSVRISQRNWTAKRPRQFWRFA
jgi:hypothetical protein